MIEVRAVPRNAAHFRDLMAFTRDVLDVCHEVGVLPILSSSLAVFAYTQNPQMDVHDVDLSCSEREFPRVQTALLQRGIDCQVTGWHVLQARRGRLKVEFDAFEFWMHGIDEPREAARIAGIDFQMVSLGDLRELYRRGLDDASEIDEAKRRGISTKLALLDGVGDR